MEWIDVNDRLPETVIESEDEFANPCLVWDSMVDEYDFGYFSKLKSGWEDKDGYNLTVSHWMPLPEPPVNA